MCPRRSDRAANGGVVWCGEPGELPHYDWMHGMDRRIGAPVTAAVIRWRRDGAGMPLSGGCAQLLTFGLEHVVQAPLGELDTGGEPEIPAFFM